MDFESIERLTEFGFTGNATIFRLQQSCDCVPAEQGIYLVVRDTEAPVRFLEIGSGGYFQNQNPNVATDTLKEAWLEKAIVLYIGKAGGHGLNTTLRKRLRTYMRFGQHQSTPHRGGRYIWQLEDAKDLKVFWKPTPDRDPRIAETELLAKFTEKYGRLPFANLRH